MSLLALDLASLPPEKLSTAERFALLPEAERAEVLSMLADEAAEALRFDWQFWARPEQRPPSTLEWAIWVLLGGRGSGKTRAGSEWANEKANTDAGSIGLFVAANPRDARDVMIEGRSGVTRTGHPSRRPTYEPSKLLLTWPNGTTAHVRSAHDPDGIRGVSADWAWCDELGKWRRQQEAWDQARFAIREGRRPQTVVTTTPTSSPVVRQLLGADRTKAQPPGTIVAERPSTFRNAANLAPDFLAELLAMYEGTRLGEQELYGLLIEDVEGALWTGALIERGRITHGFERTDSGLLVPAAVTLRTVVVGVDPPGSVNTECGIVAAGADDRRPATAYVLADYSLKGTPGEWGRAVVRCYHDTGADAVVVERNYGGDMVKHTIGTVPAHEHEGRAYPPGDGVRVREVNATRGKAIRAEPVAGFYEQTPPRTRHVGRFPELEDEQRTWIVNEPGQRSPNRLDALVWAITDLLIQHAHGTGRTSGRAVANRTLPQPQIG